jgi:hypothetical protein
MQLSLEFLLIGKFAAGRKHAVLRLYVDGIRPIRHLCRSIT